MVASGRPHDILVKNSSGDPDTHFGVEEVRDKARRMLKQHPEVSLVSLGLDAAASADSLAQICRFFQKIRFRGLPVVKPLQGQHV